MFARILTGLWQGYKLQKMSSRILVGIHCHNIRIHTAQSVSHGDSAVAKTTDIAKLAEKCISCTSGRPTPPHTNPMESGPENTFSVKNCKN